jgi:hypothetical protein
VPPKVAAEVSRVAAQFKATTGQATAPSPGSARLARMNIAKLGEPGSRQKEAADALKRLSKRLEDEKVTDKAGVLLAQLPLVRTAPGTIAKNAKVITWGPKGPMFVVEGGGHHATPRPPLVQRIVRGMSHRRGLMLGFLAITLIGAGAFAFSFFYREKREGDGDSASAI